MKNVILLGAVFAVYLTTTAEEHKQHDHMSKLDQNQNGYIELTEAVANIHLLNRFAELDKNKDTRLSQEELALLSIKHTSREKPVETAQKTEQGRL